MTKITALLLAVTMLVAPFQAMAAKEPARICALSKAMECNPDGCSEYSVQDLALPRFVRLDLSGKTMTSLDKNVVRSSSIDSVEQLKNRLTVLHGTELRGWTMVLSEETGGFTLSAAGEDEGFIVFGSCINQ